MVNGSSVTDLQMTLTLGIPSLLYVMLHPGAMEMSFTQRFDEVMSRQLQARIGSPEATSFINKHKAYLLDSFLSTIISGGRSVPAIFESFSSPFDESNCMFPLPYIPLILKFLGETEAVNLYNSLQSSAECVESGRDWELVIVLSIYLRSLAAKYCLASGVRIPCPFEITTGSVEDVKVITLDPDVKTIDQAVQYINELSFHGKLNTIRIFQLAYTKFPDFDGFVSYSSKKRCFSDLDGATPTIHGFQCKLSRGYPRQEVNNKHIGRVGFSVEVRR
jgi:hypothetical protein